MLKNLRINKKKVPVPVPLKSLNDALDWIQDTLVPPEHLITVIELDGQDIDPELVNESNWGTEETPKMRLSVYDAVVQQRINKAMQETLLLVEQQQQTIADLTARIEALEAA